MKSIMKLVRKSLKRKLWLAGGMSAMLVSGCAPVLVAGDAALCAPEFQAAVLEHNVALVEDGMSDRQAKTGDKVVSMYDAACGK